MNINPMAAAASVAGTSQAAAKGGTSDNQASDASAKLAAAKSPTGKSETAEHVDPGDPTQDRSGDGRQVLDVFEKTENEHAKDSAETKPASKRNATEGHLDFDA